MSTSKKRNTLVPVNPATSLALSTSELAQVCDAIDAGAELTETVQHYFKALELEQGKNVDLVLADIEATYNRIEKLRALKRAIDVEIKSRTTVAEAIEKAVIELVDANPDLPFVGTYQKLSTAKNPPAVEWSMNIPLKSKSFSNVIPPELVDSEAIDFRHLKTEQVFILDTKAVADDLKKGVDVPYAKLVQGKRLNPKLKD